MVKKDKTRKEKGKYVGQSCRVNFDQGGFTKCGLVDKRSGRGLIVALLPNYDVVGNLWLEPLSSEGIGCTKIKKAKTEGFMIGNVESISYLEKKNLCFDVGSMLHLRYSYKNGDSVWMGRDDSPTLNHHGNAVTALSIGDNFEYEMAAKVEKMYDLAYEKAKTILLSNQNVVEKTVNWQSLRS
ncbi:hypothetical protein LXL04_024721 [Taraxacum kok-saghyz]